MTGLGLEIAQSDIDNTKAIKQTIKRNQQIIQITLVILAINALVKVFAGLTISAILISILFTLFSGLLILNYKGFLRLTKAGTIIGLCLFLLLVTFAEGLRASAHIYFLCAIAALPVIVEAAQYNSKPLILYFIFIASCFCVCIYFCEEKSSWQDISEEVYQVLMYINNTCAVAVCGAFAWLHIYNERKYFEAIMEQKDRAEKANQAKSIFLATMSHEIRTPLNGVIGITSLLAETELNAEQQNYTHIIHSSGQSLLAVINDILDFSKIESGKMEIDHQSFSLRVCLEEVLEMFSDRGGQLDLDLMYQMAADMPQQIIGDSTRLKQILINLVGNAIKFTTHGEIVVAVNQTRSLPNGQIELAFEVRDSGIGIPADKIRHLFQAFAQVDSSTTRKYGGTGLGLAICKRLVNLMGGEIEAHSTLGVGTTFRFTLLTQKSTADNKTEEYRATAELAGKRILVVEDNATHRDILQAQLQQWQFTVLTTTSGQQALEMLQIQHYDLVITDMQMPGMDGVQLAQQIKQRNPSLPLMLLNSLNNELPDKNKSLFDNILTKPVKQQQLYRQTINCLKQEQQQVKQEPEVHKLVNSFARQHPLNILVAEDYPINQTFARMVLGKLGYTPELAENGRQVLEAVSRKNYDVILMDVQMPEMDGLEATRIIRTQAARQPYIVATTASAMKEDEQACMDAGMDDYISKPIHLDQLLKVLKKAVRVSQVA